MFTRLFQALIRRFDDWRERERAIAELNALDDRSLADIGISRTEIPFLLTRPAEPAVAAQPATHVNPPLRRAA